MSCLGSKDASETGNESQNNMAAEEGEEEVSEKTADGATKKLRFACNTHYVITTWYEDECNQKI